MDNQHGCQFVHIEWRTKERRQEGLVVLYVRVEGRIYLMLSYPILSTLCPIPTDALQYSTTKVIEYQRKTSVNSTCTEITCR